MSTAAATPRTWTTLALIAVGWLCAASQASAQSMPNTPSSAPRTVYDATTGIMQGTPALTTDVFWCAGDDKASNRALAASELAASYGILAKIDTSSPKLPPTVIRTRPIDREAFLSNLDASDAKIIGNNALVRYDPNDENSRVFANKVVLNGLRPAAVSSVAVSSASGSNYTPNYISVFVCTDLDTSTVAGRLYFQVKEPSQTEDALRAAAAVRKELPRLTVINKVEVVGSDAPTNSEVRYFFDDDAKLASRTAEAIMSTTSGTIVAKRVPGYESKVRRGTLEAWISN